MLGTLMQWGRLLESSSTHTVLLVPENGDINQQIPPGTPGHPDAEHFNNLAVLHFIIQIRVLKEEVY